MWLERIYRCPLRIKQSLFVVLDIVFIPLSIWLASALRYGFENYPFSEKEIAVCFVTVVVSIPLFTRIGLYRAVVRYMGQQAMLVVIRGITVSAVVVALSAFLLGANLPRSAPFLYWGLALLFIGGFRFIVRSLYSLRIRKAGGNVAIYGAGTCGRQLQQALFHSGVYTPVAFIDDDKALQGRVINGVCVYSFDAFIHNYESKGVAQILLALPQASRARRREIVSRLAELSVSVKTIPGFSELVSGSAKVDDVQEIDIDDLLGRDSVQPDLESVRLCLEGKVVLVTGAGGSIGSELCRQIINAGPRELLILDISEYGLYQINKELSAKCKSKSIKLIPLLGSVQNQGHLEAIFREFSVDTVYHAAAYKHVPIVEFNVAEGVLNNVFGTLKAGKAAVNCGVENFVLVSTDKAVRPTNVMGASKRLAELVLQALANKYDDTRFCMVRFGNVLGSSGSVVPLFREQVKSGGPVTVTHKDVVRYFMTIPEAAQLVLQASAMGARGDVFVLDMGDPVRITDLAERMIKLMGYKVRGGEDSGDTQEVNGSIEITYTGLRPGEKLYEELLIGDNVSGTEHPMIMRAEEEFLTEEVLDTYLDELKKACISHDCEEIQRVLLAAVTGFDAKDGISDAIWQRRSLSKTEGDNVVKGPFSKPN